MIESVPIVVTLIGFLFECGQCASLDGTIFVRHEGSSSTIGLTRLPTGYCVRP